MNRAALLEASLTPILPTLSSQWAPNRTTADVLNDEIADTLARLAIPAAIAAAGVASTMLVQYHPFAGVAGRLGRAFRWRF